MVIRYNYVVCLIVACDPLPLLGFKGYATHSPSLRLRDYDKFKKFKKFGDFMPSLTNKYKKISVICYLTKDKLNEVLSKYKDIIMRYAYILHNGDFNEDMTLKKPHIHLFIEFYERRTIYKILTDLNTKIFEIVECVEGLIIYFSHKGHNDKTQYDPKDIVAFNVDIDYIYENFNASCYSETDVLKLFLTLLNDMTLNELMIYALNHQMYHTFRVNYIILKDYYFERCKINILNKSTKMKQMS